VEEQVKTAEEQSENCEGESEGSKNARDVLPTYGFTVYQLSPLAG
jgi:hypothetical protein